MCVSGKKRERDVQHLIFQKHMKNNMNMVSKERERDIISQRVCVYYKNNHPTIYNNNLFISFFFYFFEFIFKLIL